MVFNFFFNDTATTEIYPLSLHDALPIYCDLLQRICKAAGGQHGRPLPANVTGAIGAIALDMGLPWQLTKAFALIGRTLGAVAHIGEEIRRPMAANINSAIKAQMVYDFDSK